MNQICKGFSFNSILLNYLLHYIFVCCILVVVKGGMVKKEDKEPRGWLIWSFNDLRLGWLDLNPDGCYGKRFLSHLYYLLKKKNKKEDKLEKKRTENYFLFQKEIWKKIKRILYRLLVKFNFLNTLYNFYSILPHIGTKLSKVRKFVPFLFPPGNSLSKR